MKYPNLKRLFENVFEGESYNDSIIENDALQAKIALEELHIAEEAITKHHTYIKNGIPFLGENPKFDLLVKTDKGMALIYQFVNFYN